MLAKNRRRWSVLVGAVAIGAVLLVVPAIGQETEPPDAIRFTTMGSQPRFQYDGVSPSVVQAITTASNGCQINSPAGTVMALSTKVGNQQPGFFGNSIGVKSPGSNANGTPCSQISGTETLVLKPGSDLSVSGRSFSKVRLDLEMTGNAIVELKFVGNTSVTYFLQTGTSQDVCGTIPDAPGCGGDADTSTPAYDVESGPDAADRTGVCNSPANSGPNSGANDNCIWTVEPGISFHTIELRVVSVGTVSLEGGSDTGTESLFYFSETLLTCNDTETFGDGTTEPRFTVRAQNDGAECEKTGTYEASLGIDGQQFVYLKAEGTPKVVFLERIEFLSQVVPPLDEAGQPQQVFKLYYDDSLEQNEERLAPFCKVDPRTENAEGETVIDGLYDAAGLKAALVLPGDGHTTCIISAEFVTTGVNAAGVPLVKAVFWLYNEGDGFRIIK